MAIPRAAWGIDIGNRSLKAVKLVNDGGQLRVDDFDLIEHETVLSQAGDNRDSLIQTALGTFMSRHATKGSAVAVGVSGQSSFARFIKLPPVEQKKIPEIVRFEAIQQIPFPLSDVEWDYQLFQQPDSPEIEVGIFAMRRELVNAHVKYFTDNDLNVQLVQMNPLAVYNALFYDQRLDGPTMVLDVGAENTDLLIADTDTIWMRSIPIGGNNFTDTLVKAFKLPFAKAEDLKRNAASSKYARQIFQAMRPIFADLVAEIQRSIGFYSSVHRESRIKKAIALGGTFRLPGLQKYLQQNLQLDVRTFDGIGSGQPTDPKLLASFNEHILSSVAAYGLAVQAMGEGKVTSSLLPQAIRRERMWKEKTKWFGAAAALFLVGTGLAAGRYFMDKMGFDAAESDRQQIATIESRAKDLDSRWSTEVEGVGQTDRELVKNVGSLAHDRLLWRDLLEDILKAAPVPQEPVLQGLKTGDAKLVRQVPRGERRQIVIESMTSRYQPDMTAILADPDFNKYAGTAVMPTAPGTNQPSGGGGAMDEFGRPRQGMSDMPQGGGGGDGSEGGGGGPAKPGFLITIVGTSPNADTETLLNETIVKALAEIKPSEARPNMKYMVEKVSVPRTSPIRTNSVRLQQIAAAYQASKTGQPVTPSGDSGMNRGGGMQDEFGRPMQGGGMSDLPSGGGQPWGQPAGQPDGQPTAAGSDPDAAFKDRLVTDEDVRNDWEFVIILAVTLNPPPYSPAPAEPTASAQ